MAGLERVLIVGGSAAGLFCAESLRRNGYGGDIVIAGDEAAYDRPPLSKQFLSGEWDAERLALMPSTRIEKIGADIRVGARATGLSGRDRTVRFADGSEMAADAIVIATGVRPRVLPAITGRDVHTLRSMDDSRRLIAEFQPGRRLTIVGSGFIGLEVAATAVKCGLEVSVIDPVTAPMDSRLGPEVSQRLMDMHRRAGVKFHLGVTPVGLLLDADDRLRAVTLSDGGSIETDTVLLSIGCQPNVEWLADSGIELRDGVVCDPTCKAADGVWAAGDVARWQHVGVGRQVRIEHRSNASDQGDAVARNVLGANTPFAPVPFFWTDQYDARVQVAGFLEPRSVRAIEYGSIEGGSFVQTFRVDGRLVAAVAWNAAKAMTGFRRDVTFA